LLYKKKAFATLRLAFSLKNDFYVANVQQFQVFQVFPCQETRAGDLAPLG